MSNDKYGKQALTNTHTLDGRVSKIETVTSGKQGVVATRGQTPNVGSTTLASSATGDSHRCRHLITEDCADIRFAYKNSRVTNPIQVASSGLVVNGQVYPVTFNGGLSTTLEVNASVISDPVPIDLKKGDLVYSLTYVKVTADGHQYPGGLGGFPSVGEGCVKGENITRLATVPANLVSTYMFSPIAVLGTSYKKKPSLFIVGDSISTGLGDIDPYYGAMNNGDGYGFVVRALDNNFGYYNMSKSGARAVDLTLPTGKTSSLAIMSQMDHAIVSFGINDLAQDNHTFERLKTSLLSVWNLLTARGIRVYQCTLMPCTDSTDNWLTVENQTPRNTGVGAVRAEINDYIRTCPTPLSGFFDTAEAVESSFNSGKWKPGMVLLSDKLGIHPNATGHEAASKKINTSLFM